MILRGDAPLDNDLYNFNCYKMLPAPLPADAPLPPVLSPPVPVLSLSLADQLALLRTRLANERTLLTYVRTALALVGFGLVLLQLHPTRGGRLGYASLAVAGVVALIGLLRFRANRRQLAACRPPRFA